MIKQVSQWLLDQILIVPIVPLFLSIVCILLKRAGILMGPLSDIIFLTASSSLAASYALALSIHPAPLVGILLVAPQTYVLLAMFFVVAACKLLDSSYKAPSPWWVAIVAAVGHAWTSTLLYALSVPRR